MKQKILIGLCILLLVGCSPIKTQKYDEVIYDCGSRLVKGTQIPNSEWDLENNVDVYYIYEDNYSIEHNYPLHKWMGQFSAVKLNTNCKEILRFYNYTKIEED